MAVNIQGNNYGIAVDGDLTIEKLEFEFGKGVKSASGINKDVEDAEIIEECTVDETKNVKAAPTFAFIIRRHHSQAEIDDAMEKLSVKWQGTNSRALARTLVDLDKDEFIDISDVSAAELYKELSRVFGVPNIKKDTFAESLRIQRL